MFPPVSPYMLTNPMVTDIFLYFIFRHIWAEKFVDWYEMVVWAGPIGPRFP